ncbi:MAG: glycosyltransferase family 4 protein, partial [Bacteroidetes bacterium]|nr:glycosyltransferase family 4 protein [Bacteroidota bacterium]
YVSIFEGFGIPILEAMYCGVPVITSNTSSMPEVGGNAALYVDPFSVDSIANAMEALYSDKDLRKTLTENAKIRKQKFTWDKTADKLWNSIEKLMISVCP